MDGVGQVFQGVGAVAATVATIGSAIALSAVRSRKKHLGVSMIGVDGQGNVVIPQQAFQWWPESIQDSMGIGWNFKQIPGASHGLAQWGSNTGRTFAMETKLSRSMRYAEDFAAAGPFGDIPLQAAFVRPDGPRSLAFNVDIRKMVRYLRSYCYPDYDAANGGIALPPVTCWLNVPGLQLAEDGGDTIQAVMTGCDVTYMKSFRDGKPRLATVSLGFQQVVQTPSDGVVYRTRSQLLESIGGVYGLPTSNPVPVAREFDKMSPA
ncbi:MAG TPA: hypothetical protein VM537_07835 [Anaerolineae bacterium]|nr:hypothetical protein [Anaerolineae bacterium]